MQDNWFDKYSKKHYSAGESGSGDEFDEFYELSEFDCEVNTNAAWVKCLKSIEEPARKNYFGWLWKAVAMVVLVAGLSFLLLNSFDPTPRRMEVKSKGSVQIYTLPDGSSITLSKSATVVFDERTFLENRTIGLQGKAFFDIVKSDAPFHIKTSQGNIEVLGTSFNLDVTRHLSLDVYSGLVKVTSGNQSKTVELGERAIAKNGSIEIYNKLDDNALAWKTGEFDFDEEKMKDVIPLLEEYYGVNIVSSPKLRNCKITANFSKSTLEEVVSIISTILNSEASLQNNKITFRGKGCN
ncbi:MAG: FecR domain-containing protein [Marinoscillum sp.]